jgi:nucleotide-binding universal stress UspA family protein
MFDRLTHILLPVDFSDKNVVAMDTVYDIVTAKPAKVTLLHVIEPITVNDDEEIRKFTDQLRARADSELASLASRFADLDLDVTCVTLVGNRSKTAVRHALENDVDLIVVSSHQLGSADSPRSMASVSYQIAVLATCPVLLLK